MRSTEGGYSERHLPISEESAYTLTARDRDEIYTVDSDTDANGVVAPGSRIQALRAAASEKMFGHNVQKPTAEELEEAHHHAEHEHELEAGLDHPADGHQFDGHSDHTVDEAPLRGSLIKLTTMTAPDPSRSGAVVLGLDTFGDVTVDRDGNLLPHHQVLRNVVEQAVLADQVGVDAFGVGEHHRDDFAVSAPDIVLAAAGSRTQRIILGTAVTVLSSDDPIRVYERFATLDALTNGRAEVTLGRGSFTESFPLFGLDLADYEILFEEKLALFARLREEEPGLLPGPHPAPARADTGLPDDRARLARRLGRRRRLPRVRDPRGPTRHSR